MNMIACAWRLPADEHIARYSRGLTLFALSRMDVVDDAIKAAKIMVSELATNAYKHADPPYGLRLWCSGRIAMVEVIDSTSSLPPLPCTTPSSLSAGEMLIEPLEEHGRGLAMVHHFSDGRCGVDATAAGKTVWFALPRICEECSTMDPSMLAITPSSAQLALA